MIALISSSPMVASHEPGGRSLKQRNTSMWSLGLGTEVELDAEWGKSSAESCLTIAVNSVDEGVAAIGIVEIKEDDDRRKARMSFGFVLPSKRLAWVRFPALHSRCDP
jgi:hypothetical protein